MDEDMHLSVEGTHNSKKSKRWHLPLGILCIMLSCLVLLLYVHCVKEPDFILHRGTSGSVVLLGLMGETPNTEASKNEAEMLKNLNHPNIIQYKLHYYDDRFTYLITEPAEKTLEDNIKEPVDNLKLVKDLLEGLHYLHSQNIVHGEVKFQNVVVDKNGRAKLLDFKKSHRVRAGDGRIREEIKRTGHLVFYILSGGECYYDDGWNNKDITLDFVEWMTHPEPAKRRSLQDVLYHPIFWTGSRKLRYLQSVGNLPEIMQPNNMKELNNMFKKKTWRRAVEQDSAGVLKEMDDYWICKGLRRAYPDDTWGLLRFIRNVYQHRDKQEPSIKFLSLFPDLFESVYLSVEKKNWNSEYRLCKRDE